MNITVTVLLFLVFILVVALGYVLQVTFIRAIDEDEDEYTRDQLIEAMEIYNSQYLEDPDYFTSIDDSRQCAEGQVDHLINIIEVLESSRETEPFKTAAV